MAVFENDAVAMKIPKFLKSFFKSQATREREAREEQAKLERAYDMGRRSAQTVISLIDAFYDQKLVPVAQDNANAFSQEMETRHIDPTTGAAVELLNTFKSNVEILKARAFESVWDDIGEWKYIMIELGEKEYFDRYINEKFNAVWAEVIENAATDTAYCLARISGHMTDEMHAMSPQELERYAAHNKLGRFSKT